MFASAILTMLVAAGSAHAAVAQGEWGVRADFTRCNNTTPLEVVLDGATSQSSTAPKIIDFDIPSPFDGTLVIKVAGAVGNGSPYPPQQVGIAIFDEPTGGDPRVWADATVKPGTGQPAPIAQISWNTRDDVVLTPGEDEEASLESIADGGSLVVYYCGVPEAGGPVA